MKTINIEPNWANLFKAAEAQLKAQDFDAHAFVLEMFQFGMRCYQPNLGNTGCSCGNADYGAEGHDGTEVD